MTQFLAIVAYRCFVGGEPFDSLDIRVCWFEASDEATVQKMIEGEQPVSYLNEDGAPVTWELAQIFSIDEFGTPESGEEVTGFIASSGELAALAAKR